MIIIRPHNLVASFLLELRCLERMHMTSPRVEVTQLEWRENAQATNVKRESCCATDCANRFNKKLGSFHRLLKVKEKQMEAAALLYV